MATKTTIEMAREAGEDEWKILIKQVMKHFPSEFHRFAELVRADERERLATKLTQDFKGAFGADTCASWASWLRSQK